MFYSPIETIYFIILTTCSSKNGVWKDYAPLIFRCSPNIVLSPPLGEAVGRAAWNRLLSDGTLKWHLMTFGKKVHSCVSRSKPKSVPLTLIPVLTYFSYFITNLCHNVSSLVSNDFTPCLLSYCRRSFFWSLYCSFPTPSWNAPPPPSLYVVVSHSKMI